MFLSFLDINKSGKSLGIVYQMQKYSNVETYPLNSSCSLLLPNFSVSPVFLPPRWWFSPRKGNFTGQRKVLSNSGHPSVGTVVKVSERNATVIRFIWLVQYQNGWKQKFGSESCLTGLTSYLSRKCWSWFSLQSTSTVTCSCLFIWYSWVFFIAWSPILMLKGPLKWQ